MTRDEWAGYSLILGGRYPDEAHRFTEISSEAYYSALSVFDAGVVAVALDDVTKESPRIPSCALLVAAARKITRDVMLRRPALPEASGRVGILDWIRSGRFDYRDRDEQEIPPSAVLAIWQAAGDDLPIPAGELAAADAVWGALHGA